jgi:GNAT superfamily N-acetyltransferase
MDETKIEPGEIALRLARREDVPRIAALIMQGSATEARTAAEVEAEATHPDYLRGYDEIDASPANHLFVAERGGTVIGTWQVTLIPGIIARGRRRAKLESVHVAPESRGLGLGRLMVGHALAFAKEQGAGLIELSSNKNRTDAHRFYRDLGFDQSHEGFKMTL